MKMKLVWEKYVISKQRTRIGETPEYTDTAATHHLKKHVRAELDEFDPLMSPQWSPMVQ
jgi:hypothetical protein